MEFLDKRMQVICNELKRLSIRQRIHFYADSRRIDFETWVD